MTEHNAIYFAESGSLDVQPLAIFQILDHFQRRQVDTTRVVGVLLGQAQGTAATVTSAIAVPHTEAEDGSIQLDIPLFTKLVQLQRQVNADEIMIGCYTTSTELSSFSRAVFDAFSVIDVLPKHDVMFLVNVDTSLNNSLSVKAYEATPVSTPEKILYVKFIQVHVEFKSFKADAIAVDAMIRGVPDENSHLLDAPSKVNSEFDDLKIALVHLQGLLDQVAAYLDSVVDGKTQGDADVGTAIAEALASVPHVDAAMIERVFNNSLQDMLMMAYLSNLTRAQLKLADKIHTLAA